MKNNARIRNHVTKEATNIALADIAAMAVLTFCENLMELGCPRDAPSDMWFRNLSFDDQIKVGAKMLEIIMNHPEGIK